MLIRAAADLSRRPTRTILSSLAVALGVAAVVGVLGISATASARLLASIDNLQDVLTVRLSGPASDSGSSGRLPSYSLTKAGQLAPVVSVSGVELLSDWSVLRNDLLPTDRTGGLEVFAVTGNLTRTLGVSVAHGRALTAHEQLPVVVLGSAAAQRLGVLPAAVPSRLWIASRWLTVVGVLSPAPDWIDIDNGALVGYDYAQRVGAADGTYSSLYVRTALGTSAPVAAILPATVYPQFPIQVVVDRPAAVIAAEAAARSTLNTLYLALAGIGIVGAGLGIANTLTIAVVERRAEIGLRRALGATRAQIAVQFVVEGTLVALSGTLVGALLGVWATIAYAWHLSSPVSLPAAGLAVGGCAAVAVGVVASLYPAARAATLPPSDALRLVA